VRDVAALKTGGRILALHPRTANPVPLGREGVSSRNAGGSYIPTVLKRQFPIFYDIRDQVRSVC